MAGDADVQKCSACGVPLDHFGGVLLGSDDKNDGSGHWLLCEDCYDFVRYVIRAIGGIIDLRTGSKDLDR